ncbi:hypothetical protein [Candidatus Poriferisodalis sp.]|uniref:hypothetical protein n=1 Tax=Candidatus Poriferisodalis sp. TaxID=3101277 RepID=UPI003B59201A
MPRRTLAALAALLVAASTLTVIAASPAGAHTQTKRYCAFDPFSGNQCWTENVAHKHAPPPTCGEGMLGTYPNCYPAPSTNENHDPNADKDDDSDGGDDSGDGDGDGGGDDSGGGDSGDDDTGSGDGGGDDSGGSDDDSTHTDSGDSGDSGDDDTGSGDNSGDDSGGDGGNQKGTRQNRGTTTPTTSTDPCKTWVSNTRDALHTANPDGTYNVSPAPSGCRSSNQEILAYIKVLGDAAASEIRDILEDWRESTQGVAELNDADREAAINEYKKAWNELPTPVRKVGEVTATYAGCSVLAGAAYSAVFRGKPAAGAKIAQHAAGLGCNIGLELIPPIDDSGPNDDGSGGSGGGSGGSRGGSGGSGQQPTPDPNDPDGDYDGNGETEHHELERAGQRLEDGEITGEDFIRIWRKYACDSGDTFECR